MARQMLLLLVKADPLLPSMSRSGNVSDNAAMVLWYWRGDRYAEEAKQLPDAKKQHLDKNVIGFRLSWRL
jgi:hypothetical protein